MTSGFSQRYLLVQQGTPVSAGQEATPLKTFTDEGI